MAPKQQTKTAAARLGLVGCDTSTATARQEAKKAFEDHTKSTQGKDVLERCKRLNEFLESDFLRGGGGQSKEQLQEILGILNAGPKRPSFLDKPPVTSLIRPKVKDAPKADHSSRKEDHENVDDIIGLLNPAAPASSKPRSEVAAEQRLKQLEKEEVERQRKEALNKLEVKKKETQAQEERKRLEEERQRQQALEEKRKLEERQRLLKAEEERQRHLKAEEERQKRLKAEEEQKRKQKQEEEERAAAAVVLQAAVRAFLARQAMIVLKTKWAGALTIQSAVRSWICRHQLHGLKVEAMSRRRAARCIARYYLAYKNQWHLGPLHIPPSGQTKQAMDGHAHLLEMPVRLRHAADARLAPDFVSSNAQVTEFEDGVVGKRTSDAARQRADEMEVKESKVRSDLGARTLMAASEHRDFNAVMHHVRTVGSGEVTSSGNNTSDSLLTTKSNSRPPSGSCPKVLGRVSRPGSEGDERKNKSRPVSNDGQAVARSGSLRLSLSGRPPSVA